MKTTRYYNLFWQFITERQNIFFKQVRKEKQPWTDDPILQMYKIVNVYRASDRVSQYLIKNVLYSGRQEPQEIFFRSILFRIFARIETWQMLQEKFGQLYSYDFSVSKYHSFLIQYEDTVFTKAYSIPSVKIRGSKSMIESMLMMLQILLDNYAYKDICSATSLFHVSKILRTYPLMGQFFSHQYAVDLNYSSMIDFSENETVELGPGAVKALHILFSKEEILPQQELLRRLVDNQEIECKKRGLVFQTLFGRLLTTVDMEHALCEFYKYFSGLQYTGPSLEKYAYVPRLEPIEYWYPPKWGINDKVAAYLATFT